MDASVCVSCKQPKAVTGCGVCEAVLCKKCVQRLEKDSFSFLEPVPKELTHLTYCAPCYNSHVYPAQLDYNRDIRRAKGTFIFYKAKSEQTRLLNRSEKPIRTIEVPDRDEAVLRLAFDASRAGFNAVIDVVVATKKVRNFGYQNSLFQASGVPTKVDAERLERENKNALNSN